jgi:FtsP/CotA-like multicopper oxidase with cupredoxin domain
VTVFANGTVLRQFTLIADDFKGTGKPIPITTNKDDTVFSGLHKFNATKSFEPVIFHAWTFNGTVPGPTIRVTQGDHVEVKVINANDSAFAHSWHVHSIHAGTQDGTMTASGMILPGQSYTYKFVAMPAGLYPYHCHMSPIEEHISRGLYGMMIIDPVKPRPPAAEMVMLLNSYTYSYEGLNGSGHLVPTVPATMEQMKQNLSAVEEASDENNGPDNQFYTVNGMVFGYTGPNMIQLHTGTPYRIYLVNMVEFDPANSFHMHGTMYYFQESCTPQSAKTYTDIVLLQQADRGCVEFNYTYPGEFMFHSHINHFTDLGWIGLFNVTNSTPQPTVPITTTSPSLSSLAGGSVSPQEASKK